MTSPIDNSLARFSAGPLGRASSFPGSVGPVGGATSGTSFSNTLKNAVSEVSRLQHNATTAIEHLQLGQTDDVTGVMSAVEKSELALKTLLAIRGKLMSAYDEIRNMPI